MGLQTNHLVGIIVAGALLLLLLVRMGFRGLVNTV